MGLWNTVVDVPFIGFNEIKLVTLTPLSCTGAVFSNDNLELTDPAMPLCIHQCLYAQTALTQSLCTSVGGLGMNFF